MSRSQVSSLQMRPRILTVQTRRQQGCARQIAYFPHHQIELSKLSGVICSRTQPRLGSVLRIGHPADATSPWNWPNDTIFPLRNASGKFVEFTTKNGGGGYFCIFGGLPGFRRDGTPALVASPSAASISSSFGLTLTSRHSPSSPTRTFFARRRSDMMRE